MCVLTTHRSIVLAVIVLLLIAQDPINHFIKNAVWMTFPIIIRVVITLLNRTNKLHNLKFILCAKVIH